MYFRGFKFVCSDTTPTKYCSHPFTFQQWAQRGRVYYFAVTPTDSYIYAPCFSGLFAARVLQEYGVEVVVLEARDRTGGRTFTQTVFNIPSISNCNQIQSITGFTPGWEKLKINQSINQSINLLICQSVNLSIC